MLTSTCGYVQELLERALRNPFWVGLTAISWREVRDRSPDLLSGRYKVHRNRPERNAATFGGTQTEVSRSSHDHEVDQLWLTGASDQSEGCW